MALTVWPSSIWYDRHPASRRRSMSSSRFRATPTDAALELEQLVHAARPGQARDVGDAVADLDDPTHLRGVEARLEALEVLLERRGDVGGVDGRALPSARTSLWSECGLELLEAGAHRAVDDGVAHLWRPDRRARTGRSTTLTLDVTCRWPWPSASARRVRWSSVSGTAERTSATSLLASAALEPHQLVDDRPEVARPAGARSTIDASATVTRLALPPSRSSTICWRWLTGAQRRSARCGARRRASRVQAKRNSSSSTSARLLSVRATENSADA